MRAFSQLLDDLVYTRSRNTKLRLIGDYLKETPDPDRGYGLAALTGTLDIPAVKGAAVRAIAEERVDPVLLYMSRDYVGDMAETVALLWPKPDGEPPEVDDATISISEAVERLRSASRMDAPRTLADDARSSRCVGAVRLAQAGDGRASGGDQRAARQAGAGRRLRARGRSGRGGVARPAAAVRRAVRLGRGARRAAGGPRRARLPPVHARPSARGRQGLARRLCGRVEMGRHPRPAGPRRRRDAALQPHRRRYFGQFSRFAEAFRSPRACSTASCWSADRTRAAPTSTAAPRRASTRSSNGWAARTSARRCSASYPAFVRLYDILFDGDEDLRELPWTERRARLEAFAHGSIPTDSTSRS